MCGKTFRTSPTSNIVCCSEACSAKRRMEIAENDATAPERMQAGWMKYLEANGGKLHPAAKSYVLLSPLGEVFEITNLQHWCRECGFFENPENAASNFFRISSILQGTSTRRPQYTYKGWRMLEVGDGNTALHKKEEKHCPICGKPVAKGKKTYCSAECQAEARRGRQRITEKEDAK